MHSILTTTLMPQLPRLVTDGPRDYEILQPAIRPRRVRGKRGSLERMPEMPLDVLFEIFEYLTPIDLLHLSRTSKPFRRFLMRRGNIRFWKSARKNIENLPDCPTHLSEPEYANLVFGHHCHYCGRPNIQTIYWALDVRVCKSCKKANLRQCTISNGCCPNRGDHDTISPISKDLTYRCHWHRPSAKSSMSREVFDALDDETQSLHLLAVYNIMTWASECESWAADMVHRRYEESQQLRADRQQEIMVRLRALGWGYELDQMRYGGRIRLRRHSLVDQPRKLTERAWKNIRPRMVLYMESIRRERWNSMRHTTMSQRCADFREVYTTWRKTQSVTSVLPRAIDLMRRRETRELIEANLDRKISMSHFEAFTPRFVEWTREWRVECDEKLRQLVRNSPAFENRIPDGVDPLTLAIAVFTCKKCELMRANIDYIKMVPLYPTVLMHDCLYNTTSYISMDPFERAAISASTSRTEHGGTHTFWSCEPLTVDSWVERAETVVSAFGRNPSTMSRDGMDLADDTRIYCFSCSLDSPLTREIMTWRHALRHYAAHDASKTRQNDFESDDGNSISQDSIWWERVADYRTVNVIRKKENEFKAQCEYYHDALPYGPWYDCKFCEKGGLTAEDAVTHLTSEHLIEIPTTEDVIISSDSEMSIIQPIVFLHSSYDEQMSSEVRPRNPHVDKRRAVVLDFWSPEMEGAFNP